MKPKILIVLADYYKEISVEMLKSTINHIGKKSKFNDKTIANIARTCNYPDRSYIKASV